MRKSSLSSTPKLFGSSYQPTTPNKTPQISVAWKPIIFFSLIIVVLIIVANLPFFKVKTVTLSGDVNESVETQLEGIKGRSIFSGAVSRQVETLKNDYTIESFKCRKGLPSTVSCQLITKKPTAVWQSGKDFFYIDSDGVVFSQQDVIIPGQFVIEDRMLLPVKIGAIVLSPEIIGHFQNLKYLLEEQQFVVDRFIITESLFQVTARVSKGEKQSIEVYFLLSNNLLESVTSLVKTFDSQGQAVQKSVDLRVPGYVYVR